MRKCSNCGRQCNDNEYSCKECGGVTTKVGAEVQTRYISSQETKEQIIDDKLRRFMRAHGLDSLEKSDAEIASSIAKQLAGNKLIELGTLLSFGGKAEESAKLTYLSALVEQNWLIINQLNRLNKKLDSLIDK